MGSRIVSTGRGLPRTALTNKDLERYMDTSDEWIKSRTGIGQRYALRQGESLTDIAVDASRTALERAAKVAISSTKSMTGHTLGAAGAIESVYTVLAIERGMLPPTINQEFPDPECDLDYVPNRPRAAKIRIALNNSFGFGGTNTTLAFRPANLS